MIQIENISFKYAGSKKPVFQDFSLKLESNKIYGLLGKNGTGKSTLLYLVSGLLRAQRGKVTFDSVETCRRLPATLSEIFIVPEELRLPATTLEAYVRVVEPFYPRFSREVLNSCLNDFDLPSSLHLDALSMGQKKKAFMSIALAAGTKLLLMDEPTNGIDIPSKTQFRRVVANNMSDERTLIISTHQVHDIEQLLDHILILDQHSLLLDTSVADLCEKYSFEYRQPGQPMDDVVYSEPALQGNAVIARRQPSGAETQLNLELLFNYINSTKKS